MSKIDPRQDCLGCEQDFYNGKNPYGVQQCWNVPTAKMMEVKYLSVDQPAPEQFLQTAPWEKRPNCYQRKRVIYAKGGEWGLPTEAVE